MFLLLCIFTHYCTYASEQKKIELSTPLLATTQPNYNTDNCNKEYWQNNMITFVNTIEDTVESFTPSNFIQNVELCPNKPLSPILLEMNSFFQNNNIDDTIRDELKELFKIIDYVEPDEQYSKKIICDFKLMLYRIEKENSISTIQNSHNDFLKSAMKHMLDDYDAYYPTVKFGAIVIAVTTIAFPLFGTVLVIFSKDPQEATPHMASLFGIATLAVYFLVGEFYFGKYFAYKRHLEYIKKIYNDLNYVNKIL